MPGPAAVAVVPTIETSAVMQNSGFVAATKIGAEAFIQDLIAGDALAVGSFGVQGSVAYPSTSTLVVVDATLSQLTAAAAAVQALTFTDPSVNIGAGLQTAYGLFSTAPAGSLPGVLLISSGQQSAGGTDPLKLATYQPTWVCALGPSANQILLDQIARLSHGIYHYVPTVADMQLILNEIRGQLPGWQTVINQSKSVDPLGFWLQPVTLASGLAQAQFSIVWENANFTYTAAANPGPNQVSVTLVKPPGITVTMVPTALGGGYCVFNIQNPASGPGPWYVQVMYPGSTPLPMTAAVFALPSSHAPALVLRPPAAPQPGAPIHLHATLEHGGEPVEIETATAEIVTPVPDGDVPRHQRRGIAIAPSEKGELSFTAVDVATEGSLNCKVHVRGRLARSGAAFELTKLLSIYVPG